MDQKTTEFLRRIPKRLAAIEQNLIDLNAPSWDPARLEALFHRAHELAIGSAEFDLYQLNEAAFSLETYLSSFVGSMRRPSAHQLDALTGLVRGLKAAAETLDISPEPETKTASAETAPTDQAKTLFAYCPPDSIAQGPLRLLEQTGMRTQVFGDAEDLVQALSRQQPAALLVDTAMLANFSPISAELTRLKKHSDLLVPTLFVSSSDALELRVDAMRAGAGAYFVAPIDDQAVVKSLKRLIKPKDETAYRIMIVEDDPTQADFAASILRKANMEVATVSEPLKVMDTLKDFRPDLVLMDIYLPDINGIELTTIIREHAEFVALPIVFLSGEQDADKQQDALSVGGDDFLPKPIRPKHLINVVSNRVKRTRELSQALGTSRNRDASTGLFSRRHLQNRLSAAIEKALAKGHGAAFIYLEPVNPKRLRSKLGMGGLDTLIGSLGERLVQAVDAAEVVARLSDHALGILIKAESEAAARQRAEQLQQRVTAEPFRELAVAGRIGVNWGLCPCAPEFEDADNIIHRARKACERSIVRANGQAERRPKAVLEEPESELNKAEYLKTALEKDQLTLEFQPVIDLNRRSREIYELKYHLRLPGNDRLREREVQKLAHDSGLSPTLDRWLLDQALQLLMERRDLGHETYLFVPQSATTALDPNHPAWLVGRLRTQLMVGTGLIMMYRVTDVSKDLKSVRRNFDAYRDMGAQVAISQFPEKEAALKLLKYMSADYVRIARRLLASDKQVIRKLVSQAHRLGAKVIVGDIDDPKNLDLHWSSGADLLQGNFIQRPMDQLDYDFSQVAVG